MSTVYMSAAIESDRSDGARPPSAGAAFGVVGLCAAALALTWVVAALVPATHVKDAVALYDFTLLGGPSLDDLANALLALFDPSLFTLWGLILVVVALNRGRPRIALAVALMLSLAPLTAELLKPLLARPHAWVGGAWVNPASWPSGHATAVTALAMCAVLVAPERLRPIVAGLGAMLAAAVGFSLLVLAWHLPSDVLGGYLLGTLWAALAVAVLRAAESRSRARHLRARLAAPAANPGGVGAGIP
jgi:membrane-associated phospholipid phosphatase